MFDRMQVANAFNYIKMNSEQFHRKLQHRLQQNRYTLLNRLPRYSLLVKNCAQHLKLRRNNKHHLKF